MTIDATAVRRGPAALLDDYFRSTLDVLETLSRDLGAVLGDLESRGELSDRRLDELVEPLALAVFTRTWPAAFGAGFVASLDLRGPSRGHLSWWQGPMRSQLRLAAQTPSREHIDYSGFEWFRVPRETGEGHVAGPHVDYLCSDEYTLTVSMPVWNGRRFLGVVAMDLLVDDVERELLPALREFGDVSVVNAAQRVLASTESRLAPGDSVRDLDGYGSTDCAIAGLRVLTRV
ncbi:cache domain-containing protein [Pseudoclavibacter sp. AY1H1]|uniref:cache domain-containing protein n=1 Tax=Pseudoclavibacter sp. AY1H1 TaxID=2080584 RepID=UPI000CE865C0|nr:cache domain-containing protein [Pseudoclavibacter sp. AY1H1]PPF34603.1 hypothetical protein C5E05_14895 [Pseudoclavibacter sp. AY1H1]